MAAPAKKERIQRVADEWRADAAEKAERAKKLRSQATRLNAEAAFIDAEIAEMEASAKRLDWLTS
jgi:hypothetical protein